MKYEVRRSRDTRQPFYWRIVAANGEPLATSETLTSKDACLKAIAAVKSGGSTASVVDLT